MQNGGKPHTSIQSVFSSVSMTIRKVLWISVREENKEEAPLTVKVKHPSQEKKKGGITTTRLNNLFGMSVSFP